MEKFTLVLMLSFLATLAYGLLLLRKGSFLSVANVSGLVIFLAVLFVGASLSAKASDEPAFEFIWGEVVATECHKVASGDSVVGSAVGGIAGRAFFGGWAGEAAGSWVGAKSASRPVHECLSVVAVLEGVEVVRSIGRKVRKGQKIRLAKDPNGEFWAVHHPR